MYLQGHRIAAERGAHARRDATLSRVKRVHPLHGLVCAGLLFALSFGSAKAVDYPPDFPPPLVLPQPTERVAFPKELRACHPRVFIDAAGVAAFRKKITNPVMAPLWAAFLRDAAASAATTPPSNPRSENEVRPIGDRLPRIAFACLITRQPQYLAGARKWIHAVLGYPMWATDIDLGASHVTFGMALAYDWLHDDLSPEERRQMETALLKHGRLLLARSVKYPTAWWGAAYFQNHCWINHTGIATAAMALFDQDPAEMQGWLDYTRSRFQMTYRHLGIDGGYHEGPAYLNYGTEWCLYYLEALRSISGEDLGDMPYLQNLARHILDTTMPDGRNIANFGDCDALGWGPDDCILAWLAARKKDGHAEWLRRKARSQFVHQLAFNSPFALLWLDPSVAPQSPDDLPTCGLYADLQLVVMRTSWKDDAAAVAFHCGPPGGLHIVKEWASFPHAAPTFGHSHPDANSFLFWSDKQWRIGAPGGYTRCKQTHSENVWMVGGQGQRGSDQEWFEPASYFVPGLAQPHLIRVATSPAADYVIGEAAPAYEAGCKLTEFKRHLLCVKGSKPYVVVYDRLRASEPQSWAAYLHTFGKIAVADNHSFSAAGCPPPTEEWLRLPSLPDFTTAYGVVLGPAGTTLDAHALKVIGHPSNKAEERGFELLAQPPGTSAATWLITVVGAEQRDVSREGSDREPAVKVGTDQIVWDADGNVSLNGKPVAGNLLATP